MRFPQREGLNSRSLICQSWGNGWDGGNPIREFPSFIGMNEGRKEMFHLTMHSTVRDGLLFPISSKGSFIYTDRIVHTFAIPVTEQWLEREIGRDPS